MGIKETFSKSGPLSYRENSNESKEEKPLQEQEVDLRMKLKTQLKFAGNFIGTSRAEDIGEIYIRLGKYKNAAPYLLLCPNGGHYYSVFAALSEEELAEAYAEAIRRAKASEDFFRSQHPNGMDSRTGLTWLDYQNMADASREWIERLEKEQTEQTWKTWKKKIFEKED